MRVYKHILSYYLTLLVGIDYLTLQQGSGKPEFFRSQTEIQKLGPIWNSQKSKKSVPYWPYTKEIFSDSAGYLGYYQIQNLSSSDVNALITHD